MKKEKSTPYLELAEKIAENIELVWFCCVQLPYQYRQLLEYLYKPSLKERKQYGMNMPLPSVSDPFLCSNYPNWVADNEFRILALLLCHEIYLSETK